MGDWKDDKDLGPWDFVAQPNKWGYLNDPRWKATSEDPTSYNSNPGDEPQVWTPRGGGGVAYSSGGRTPHNPCGHWHKFPPWLLTQLSFANNCFASADIYGTSQPFVLFPFWTQNTCTVCEPTTRSGPHGEVGIASDHAGRVWVPGEGMVVYDEGVQWSLIDQDLDIVYGQYIDAQVESDEYFAYCASNWADPYNTFIWVFRNGVLTRRSFFLSDVNQDEANERMRFGMNGAHIIVPTNFGHYTPDPDETGAKVAVSHDYGANFSEVTVFTIAHNNSICYAAGVDIASDGTVWLCVGHRNTVTATYEYRLYKSTDNGDTWAYVNAISVGSGDGRHHFLYLDGSTIYVACANSVYRSTDDGVTIPVLQNFGQNCAAVAANGSVICAYTDTPSGGYYNGYIRRSTDNGASWNIVKTMSNALGYGGFASGPKLTRYGNTWVFVSWGLTDQSANLYRMYLISYDNGATWQDVVAPFGRFEGSYITSFERGIY